MDLRTHTNRRQILGLASGMALGFNALHSNKANAARPSLKSVQLEIPPRLQWDDIDGYCGECSIQQAGLYFGTYVSQFVCRGIINPNQNSQLLVGVNEKTVLTALRLNSSSFDFTRARTPQFPAYYAWLKQNLNQFYPVLITAFVNGLSDPDYDHIMLATGFQSIDATTYHPEDLFYFNDCYSPSVCIRTASTLSDTRKMKTNGSKFEFCIPNNVCYGTAITGIMDASKQALPVHITMEKWSEPDIISGFSPITLNGVVTVYGLTPGKSYSLYRYNDYRIVPTNNYSKSTKSSVVNFVAKSSTTTFKAAFPSNGIAVYRCLPSGI